MARRNICDKRLAFWQPLASKADNIVIAGQATKCALTPNFREKVL
jgi:hypothetical protein